MKNFKTAIAALIIAGGTIGAFAFTKVDKTAKNENKAKVLTTFYAIEDTPGSSTCCEINFRRDFK